MAQIKRQVLGRRIALGGLRLQTAQDHLLQPLWQIGSQLARRWRVHPQALAHPAIGLGRAKRQLTGGKLIEHDADRKNVAARITPHADHLLGRNPGRRTDRLAQLLSQQIGIERIAGQAKVKQHGTAVRTDQNVGGFEVQVHRVLLVQAVHGQRDRCTELRQFIHARALGRIEPVLQRAPMHVLHHQIGYVFQIASRHKTRHVRAAEHLHELVLDFETDDVFCAVTRRHARHLHGQRETRIAHAFGVAHVVNVGHATGMDALLDREAVEFSAGFEQFHRPSSSRSANCAGKAACRMATAAAW